MSFGLMRPFRGYTEREYIRRHQHVFTDTKIDSECVIYILTLMLKTVNVSFLKCVHYNTMNSNRQRMALRCLCLPRRE